MSLIRSEHGFNTTCITKLFPTRSHTVVAQEGTKISEVSQERTCVGVADGRYDLANNRLGV
ncbi:hypothetical protein SORBI_3002G149000 [Sorghum bicolor]|uniref:Uncharacterized protein n=1 Tax=Sorghum bicolor TaxID=4558 RepID=A0A1B6QBE3_SORBI|nr:hypothetical protein SORBI_3002G149000 [Sorghum bicolor]